MATIEQVFQTTDFSQEYFELAEEIVRDTKQNYDSDRNIQPRSTQLGITITETADLVLADPNEEPTKRQALKAIKAFFETYPEDFAQHLQMTYPAFAYTGIKNLSNPEVRQFWLTVQDYGLANPQNKSPYILWLTHQTTALLGKTKPISTKGRF